MLGVVVDVHEEAGLEVEVRQLLVHGGQGLVHVLHAHLGVAGEDPDHLVVSGTVARESGEPVLIVGVNDSQVRLVLEGLVEEGDEDAVVANLGLALDTSSAGLDEVEIGLGELNRVADVEGGVGSLSVLNLRASSVLWLVLLNLGDVGLLVPGTHHLGELNGLGVEIDNSTLVDLIGSERGSDILVDVLGESVDGVGKSSIHY